MHFSVKKGFVFFCLGLFAVSFLVAENIPASAVSTSTVKDSITGDYVLSIDEDGDVKISTDEFNVWISVDEEKQLLYFQTAWLANESISDSRANKIVNGWNRDKIFGKAWYKVKDGKGSFRIEYYMTYKGGINTVNLNESVRWIFLIAKDFELLLDEEDAR